MSYEKTLATNRQAGFNYHILDRIETGVVLHGTEVRDGKIRSIDRLEFMRKRPHI